MMKRVGKIAKSKNLSVEGLNDHFVGKHLDDINNEYEDLSKDRTSQEVAQEMVYEAMDMASGKKKTALL